MRKRSFAIWFALVGCGGDFDTESLGSSSADLTLADGTWMIHALGTRCWDLGDGKSTPINGGRVTLRTCNAKAPATQQIRVTEIDSSHDVTLAAPPATVGAPPSLCITVDGAVAENTMLVLRACQRDKATQQPIPTQRFAFDGDAVLIGTQPAGVHVTRDFVAKPLREATPAGTPIVVGLRVTSDAEYFRMTVVSPPTQAYPHHGFKVVTSQSELVAALGRGWGTVVEIYAATVIDVVGPDPIIIHDGQTVRGYRKLLDDSSLVRFPTFLGDSRAMFLVEGSHVRVTGFRLQGPSEDPADWIDGQPTLHVGVLVQDTAATPLTDVYIDHLQTYAWTEAGIAVQSDDMFDGLDCPPVVPPFPRPTSIRVLNNFMHQNEMYGDGYGVLFDFGGFGLVSRNLMYGNRHSITASFTPSNGYVANYNFVLSESPDYSHNVPEPHGPTPDFDKHGRGSGDDNDHSWMGGYSNDYAIIEFNTFLGTNRMNVFERGTPCNFTSVSHNRFRSLNLPGFGPLAIVTLSKDLTKDLFDPNDFGIADPTDNLAVGDFDGDGHDDVFAATGNSWWFSSGAQSEWRFLNSASETVDQLRFGDFDGDHRTDVVAVHDGNVDIAWAGGSSWETLVTLPTGTSIDDLAVGDFDGDGKSDLFVATGSDWFVAYGGHGWQLYANSTYRVRDLLFGDFDGLGKTDIIGNQGGHWSIVTGGMNTWSPSWNPTQSTDISKDTYRVGNFDGIPGDDVMRRTSSNVWEVSSKGAGPFVAFRANAESLVGKPIGRFDADSKSDVGVFQDLHLFIASGGKDPLVNQSIHDLR